jgi:hypothetical protein
VVNATHVILCLNKEKRQHLREGRKNTREILVNDMPRVARAMKGFFNEMRMMKIRRAKRWALTAKKDKSKLTATTSTEWLQLAIIATKQSPPTSFS